MARAPSVILTPTQKKEATIDAKLEASKTKAALAELNKNRKAFIDVYCKAVKNIEAQAAAADKIHALAVKDFDKQKLVASKTNEITLKAHDKLITTAQKAATTADQKLLALVPPKAVPSLTAAE